MNTHQSTLSMRAILAVAAIGFLVTGGYALMNLTSEGHAAFNGSNYGLH